jgi:hypothetical protein
MPHRFFDLFPRINYSLPLVANTEAQTIGAPIPPISITHALAHIAIPLLEDLRATNFVDYVVSDGERPDTVAETFYGSDKYTWLVLMSSGVRGLQDWPMSAREFEQYILDTYGTVANAHSQIYGYRDADGDGIDETTYNSSVDGVIVTMYEREVEVNEARRQIKLAPRNMIGTLQKQLEAALGQANTNISVND